MCYIKIMFALALQLVSVFLVIWWKKELCILHLFFYMHDPFFLFLKYLFFTKKYQYMYICI